jgi:hypothetical protein
LPIGPLHVATSLEWEEKLRKKQGAKGDSTVRRDEILGGVEMIVEGGLAYLVKIILEDSTRCSILRIDSLQRAGHKQM